MKKITKLAYAGAIALLSAGFYACSSSDEMETVNPTYDGKAVKTSFTISIGDVKGNTTRMSETSVQKAETFQGMTDIYLFPAKAAFTDDSKLTESVIVLNDLSSTDLATPSNAKVYNDVNLSVGVSHFLFYAAIKGDKKGNGELKPYYLPMAKEVFNGTADWPLNLLTSETKASDITFDLVPYQKDNGIAYIQEQGAATVAPLNAVATVLNQQITAATTASETAVATALQGVYDKLLNKVVEGTTLVYNPYAGSAVSIQKLLEDLYNYLKTDATAPFSTYAGPVITEIEKSFTPSGTAPEAELTWTTANEFPRNLNLPDGSVAVVYKDGAFNYTDAFTIDGQTAPAINNYVHPARLYYTVNTPAMTRSSAYLEGVKTTNTWAEIATATNYPGSSVLPTTQSVIMKDQIQYSVGRLDVQVRIDPTVNLKDNGSGPSNEQVVLPPSAGYTLTGVLVGGQKQVGWNFKPKATAPNQTIYDNVMTGTIKALASESYSDANSTLVLESEEKVVDATSGTVTNDGKVTIALEFENTGSDFYGVNHILIPSGSRFYLLAKLEPGVNETANPETLKQVFKQDYITTAKLTIGENSLKNAYNEVPDLRSPKLEFGLSVDLTWRAGITFTQVFE